MVPIEVYELAVYISARSSRAICEMVYLYARCGCRFICEMGCVYIYIHSMRDVAVDLYARWGVYIYIYIYIYIHSMRDVYQSCHGYFHKRPRRRQRQ